MLDKSAIYVILIAIGLGIVHFIMMPAFHKNSATKVVKAVLDDWSEDRMLSAMNHWEDRDTYPNMVKLNSYRIKSKKLFKTKDSISTKIKADLKFIKNRFIPMNSEWEIIVNGGKQGWKIASLEVSDLSPEDMHPIHDEEESPANRKPKPLADNITVKETFKTEQPAPAPPAPKPVVQQPSQPKYKAIPAKID